MLGTKLIGGAAALVAGLAVTATAEAAPRLSSVGSAAYAHPGGELVVQATARRAPRVRFLLSADRRRTLDDVKLAGTGRARRARRVVVRVAARVPAAAPLGTFRIWWARNREQDGEIAASLAPELATAYERFKAIMGRDLLPDDKTECYHGSDGAYDIYLLDRLADGWAITIPSAQSRKNNLICDGTPSFIVVETGNRRPSRWTLAHELFHAFQYVFPYKADCRDYLWFDEGAANWGAHAAFPSDDAEHHWKDLLRHPMSSLNTQRYDSWPFALFLEHAGGGTERIRRIYEQFGVAEALPAIDRAIGSFRARWPEFTRFGWNQPPLEPSFKAWDRFAEVPLTKSYKPIEPVRLELGGKSSHVVPVDGVLAPLARNYQLFGVVDEKVRELRFENTLAGVPGAAVQAIVTLADGSRHVQDWTARSDVAFCRDKPAERVTDLVLMISNSNFAPEAWLNPKAAPSFKLSSACDGPPYYYRTISASFSTRTTGSHAGGTCAPVGGISATKDFGGQVGGLPFDGASKLQRDGGHLIGTVGALVPAKWVNRLRGCTYDPADGTVERCETTREETPLPDGKWPIGFAIFAGAPDASTARLSWSLTFPAVGIPGAGNRECNASYIMQNVPSELTTRHVPLARLASMQPQTFSFEGTHHWDKDLFGRPTPMDYTWTFTITVQRVDATGKPL